MKINRTQFQSFRPPSPQVTAEASQEEPVDSFSFGSEDAHTIISGVMMNSLAAGTIGAAAGLGFGLHTSQGALVTAACAVGGFVGGFALAFRSLT